MVGNSSGQEAHDNVQGLYTIPALKFVPEKCWKEEDKIIGGEVSYNNGLSARSDFFLGVTEM